LGLGIWEMVILLAIVALLFGTKGVPQMARRLGGSVREVKDAVAEVDPRRMLEAPADSTQKPPATRAGGTRPAASTPRPPDDPQV
jgi:sec-independent protein translocase protein TatA